MDERAVLVVDTSGVCVSLPRNGELSIGRDASNDVVLDSPSVSRRHARLRSTVDGWVITDEGSSNGTYVDGGPRLTDDGSVVGVGTRVRFGEVGCEITSTTTSEPPARVAPPTGRKVFVSYSRTDTREVDRLVQDLERCGIDVWVDRAALVGGADWTAEIVKAIREADAFVVALSRRSVESDAVANELHLAGECELPVMPVFFERVEIPESLAFYLAGRQRYDLTGESRPVEIDRLVRAIKSPRVRHHRQLRTTRHLAVAALVLVLLLGIPAAVLSVLTGSVPPDIGRISGSRDCDGLDVSIATEGVTTFVRDKTAHLAISFSNTSGTDIGLGDWSVDLTSGGGSGEPYRFIENEGVENVTLRPGDRTTGRIAVGGNFAPSVGDEPVRLEVSGLEQGDSVFAKCSVTSRGVIEWG